MLGGIDIGTAQTVVVTDTGATRHPGSGDTDGPTTLSRLEAVLTDVLDTDTPGSESRLGYVNRDPDVLAQLEHAGERLDVRVKPIDPGTAVCYDVFGSVPNGVGVALGGGQAVATLAVDGVPVATARLDYDERWYDVTDSGAVVAGDGLQAAWAAVRYEAVLGALGNTLAASAPSLGEGLDVALGGADAPASVDDRSVESLAAGLQTTVASVTVADDSGAAPARGAFRAVQETAAEPSPVPAVAATDAYVPALADVEAATATLATGVDRSAVQPGAVDDTDDAASSVTDRDSGGSTPRDTQTRLASALDRLVDHLDDDERSDRIAALRDDIEATLADIEAELDDVAERTPPAGAISTLESSVAATDDAIADLEEDVTALQTALSGLDDEDGVADSDALGSVATDALQSDIEDVEQTLSNRIESLWDELDDINDKLVDLSASVGDVPTIEDDLQSTVESVEELSSETTDLTQSVSALREELDEVDQQAATTADVEAVRTDLDSLASDLDELESTFRTIERADPTELQELGRDLDALRETVVDHAKRLEGVERTVSDLDDRITQAFQDTAKAEALSSLQAEVSRIRESASTATERATDAAETTDELDDTVETLTGDIEQLRQTVDGLAESSATRSEVTDLQARLDDLERDHQALRDRLAGQGGVGTFPLVLIGVGLASVGVLGALLALELDEPVFAVGFTVLGVGPAAWLALTVSDL